jgi:DNA processing protein
MDEAYAWLALARAPGLHAGHLGEWLARNGPPGTLLRASTQSLAALGLDGPVVAALHRPDDEAIARDLQWLDGPERSLLAWGAPDYPPLLAQIPDAPLVLFVEGDVHALSLPQLAMVGSRNPTALGRDTAAQFAEHLVRAGLAVTSGLALGIDAASHRGALRGSGRTIAVLGCGLDTVYPRENAGLAAEIVASGGALVTDLPIGSPPLKQHFPRRNRLISGLAIGTLVVEAALQSGSLITARLAGDQGREVFAIPGSIHNPMARGCHRLLRQGARLVEGVDDIFQELGALVGALKPPEGAEPADPQTVFRGKLDKDQEILLDALGFGTAGVDTLVARTGLRAEAVASMLLILELDGRVQQQPGGRYSRRLPGKV